MLFNSASGQTSKSRRNMEAKGDSFSLGVNLLRYAVVHLFGGGYEKYPGFLAPITLAECLSEIVKMYAISDRTPDAHLRDVIAYCNLVRVVFKVDADVGYFDDTVTRYLRKARLRVDSCVVDTPIVVDDHNGLFGDAAESGSFSVNKAVSGVYDGIDEKRVYWSALNRMMQVLMKLASDSVIALDAHEDVLAHIGVQQYVRGAFAHKDYEFGYFLQSAANFVDAVAVGDERKPMRGRAMQQDDHTQKLALRRTVGQPRYDIDKLVTLCRHSSGAKDAKAKSYLGGDMGLGDVIANASFDRAIHQHAKILSGEGKTHDMSIPVALAVVDQGGSLDERLDVLRCCARAMLLGRIYVEMTGHKHGGYATPDGSSLSLAEKANELFHFCVILSSRILSLDDGIPPGYVRVALLNIASALSHLSLSLRYESEYRMVCKLSGSGLLLRRSFVYCTDSFKLRSALGDVSITSSLNAMVQTSQLANDMTGGGAHSAILSMWKHLLSIRVAHKKEWEIVDNIRRLPVAMLLADLE